MPCMCGDSCCPQCGTAQGNYQCPVCGEWLSDGGCENPERCQEKLSVILQNEEDAVNKLLIEEDEND